MLVVLVGLAGALDLRDRRLLRRASPRNASRRCGSSRLGGTHRALPPDCRHAAPRRLLVVRRRVLWGGLSGVAGSVAILTLYAALAIGPMSILSPLTAVISAIVPLTLGPRSWASACRSSATSRSGSRSSRSCSSASCPRRVPCARRCAASLMRSISGVLIGVLLILLDRAPDDSGLHPAGLQPRQLPRASCGRSCCVLAVVAPGPARTARPAGSARRSG